MTGREELPSEPWGARSISLGVYAPDRADTSATEMLDYVVAQALAAERAGFDGITASEHHAAFATYFPNPLLLVSWLMPETGSMWGAPCPILLPLRPPAFVIEDIAWLAIRFPGRVGVGFAPGWFADDFVVASASYDDRRARHWSALHDVCQALTFGVAEGPLGRDKAVLAAASAPIPVLSSAGGPLGARRAARAGAGIMPGSLENMSRLRELFGEYEGAGGKGARVVVRRVWLGDPGGSLDNLLGTYRDVPGESSFMEAVSPAEYVISSNPEEVVELLRAVVVDSGATALNLRVGLGIPDIPVEAMLEQIMRLGEEVLPALRSALDSVAMTP